MLEEIETDVSVCKRQSVYDFPDRIEYIFLMDFEADAECIPLHEGQRLQWFAEAEIPWNNHLLLLNMTFLKQQVPLLTSPMIWKIVGKAASIYSGSLIKR